MTEFFHQYWWLIFPALAVVYGVVGMILRNSYEKKKLELLKTYLDRGQPVPEAMRRDNPF